MSFILCHFSVTSAHVEIVETSETWQNELLDFLETAQFDMLHVSHQWKSVLAIDDNSVDRLSEIYLEYWLKLIGNYRKWMSRFFSSIYNFYFVRAMMYFVAFNNKEIEIIQDS